ncbi:MAG: hypothetical protein C4297_00625 [Gemmataceae bacterium]
MCRQCQGVLRVGALVLPWAVTLLCLQADTVVLKDGTVLSGRIEREGTVVRDPASGQELWMPKIGGFYSIDDGVRRVAFSQRNVVDVQPDKGPADEEIIHIREPLFVYTTSPPIREVKSLRVVEDWTSAGTRRIRINDDSRVLEQQIVLITPHAVRVGCRRWRWMAAHAPEEFSPDLLVRVVRSELEKRPPPGPKWSGAYRLFRLCLQAGWLDHAQRILDEIRMAFPDEKDNVDKQQRLLDRARRKKSLEDLELALAAGQYERAQHIVAEAGPLPRTEEEPLAERWSKQTQLLQTRLERYRRASDLAARLHKRAKEQAKLAALADALEVVARELCPDNVERLEACLHLLTPRWEQRLAMPYDSTDAELEEQVKQLAALAVSGWVVGASGADSDPAVALRLWHARDFVLRYLRADDPAARRQILASYLGTDPVRWDVLLALLAYVPAPDPLPARADRTYRFSLPGSQREHEALVVLPPEYHPARPYPLILLLPAPGTELEDAVEPWQAWAGRYGFILAALRWADPFLERYRFDDAYVAMVQAALRHIARVCVIDNDRVYLVGHGPGGSLACDIGLTCPDRFAGVVVVSGRPSEQAVALRPNAQHLPFYVVAGERDGDTPQRNRRQFEHWISKGYPALYVEYRGRGGEFFVGEIPRICAWMKRQKRMDAFPVLGRSEELVATGDSVRTFYWIEGDIRGASTRAPARLSARRQQINHFVVSQSRMNRITILLHPSLVDFEQPIVVEVNRAALNSRTFRGKMEPSVDTILEDYERRMDRIRLTVARLEINL